MNISTFVSFLRNRRCARKEATSAQRAVDKPFLQVEKLEDRTLLSTLDLTTPHSSGTINDATFRQVDTQPTGTGVINSFVRLQGKGSVEQGYNTDFRPLQFDEKKSPQFTRSLPLSSVPMVSVNGVSHREFLLDINQKASQPFLSLDELRVFVSSSPNLTGYNTATNQLPGATLVYDLDAGTNNWIKLDANLNSGSGSGDMIANIPNARFGSPNANNQFVYLYSKFGVNIAINGGFEEWAVKRTSGPSPTEFATLGGCVYVDTDGNRAMDASEGLEGVKVTLTGTDSQGPLEAFTRADGCYTFAGLLPGTYTIMEDQDSANAANPYIVDGGAQVGTVNAIPNGMAVDSNTITDIVLSADDFGIDYNFFELPGQFG